VKLAFRGRLVVVFIAVAALSGGVVATTSYAVIPRSELDDSLAELRRMLLLGWLVAVALAALFGSAVARRTLRPVRRAAEASQAIAEGLLDTRLEQDRDEFDVLATSFNHMASAVEQQVEELQASAERERQFTADVAHELRTPLTGMVSAASVLEGHLPDLHDGPRRPAELLVNDVHRLRELVSELLELARLDAGREEPQFEPVSVRRCIESIVAPWQRDTVFRWDVSESLWVCADRIRFGRVVANLVSNAVRHGGGDVELTARPEDGCVVIDVMDRGPGVPEEVARQVFERFTRLDGSRSTEGSGLGLAIAAKQAEVQHGELSVHNRPGGGAIFRFILPAADSPEGGVEEAGSCAPAVEPAIEPAVASAVTDDDEPDRCDQAVRMPTFE
jgi:two-component system sensor histidine kinase MtrB